MITKVKSFCLSGLDGHLVETEADASSGLPAFDIVGLPDTAVKESKERVRAAIKNCGFDFPSRRYTVNLAPANIKKEGPSFDLPIALAILGATEQLNCKYDDYVILGELSLAGEIRAVKGILPSIHSAVKEGFSRFIIPYNNREEGALVEGAEIYGAKTLFDAVRHLRGTSPIEKTTVNIQEMLISGRDYSFDFSEVKGQENVKRALEIAAAGGHNCLMIGSPGSGKTMLAQRLPTILPDLTLNEALEVTKIHSIAGVLADDNPLITARPFRSPHHSISTVGLSGGGANAKPGEISLAHNGVLFLDELPEFHKDAIEVMRQPMEDGRVRITRAAASYEYPSKFMLIAAMNPCRCGYYGDPTRKCRCTEASVTKYLSRISGPLLDRIDIQTEASAVTYGDLQTGPSESSAVIRAKVTRARQLQHKRYTGTDIYCNSMLSGSNVTKFCVMNKRAEELIKSAYDSLGLSARAYSRILKVARTIADMEESDGITDMHIADAVQYRSLDKKFWN